MLVLQLGLLVALIRYRLYDAEAIISRTATAAILTVAIGGTFAAVMEGIITGIQFVYPESEASQTIAAMGGAVVAAVFIEPVNRKTHAWVERRFHKALLEIRETIPELMRDTRDSASLDRFPGDHPRPVGRRRSLGSWRSHSRRPSQARRSEPRMSMSFDGREKS